MSGGDGRTSTVYAETVTGWHILKVEGYTQIKGLGVGKHVKSGTFTVGGHSWRITCYPDGHIHDTADWISVYLHLGCATNGGVRASFKMSLLDQAGEQVQSHTQTSPTHTFSDRASFGFFKFIKKKDLESSFLEDDSFQIRCDVTVVQEIKTKVIATESVTVPPPDLQRHLVDLLASEVGGDVTFDVGGELFTAHRYMLAARSSVFMAELFGSMKEKLTTEHVRIDDMDARVFKIMLHFIYTDTLPEIEGADKIVTAQHFLVAADRYNLQRLKLVCEEMLCSSVDMSTVGTTLALAEQHACLGLKNMCFEFLKLPGHLKAVMASDGFQHLNSSCPSLLEELLAMFAP